MNDINQLIIDCFSNVQMWAAIVANISIILIGWLLVKIKIFKSVWKEALTCVVLFIAYPAIIIKSFMNTTYLEEFNTQGIVLGLSCGFYIVGGFMYVIWNKFILNKILAHKKNKQMIDETIAKNKLDKSVNLWMMCIFGSTIFFGTPIINALNIKDGLTTQIIWNTPFTIGLATFCQFQYLNIKFNKTNSKRIFKTFLAPIVLVSIICLLLWISQLIPGSYVKNTLNTYPDKYHYGVWWFDLQYSAPFLYKTINILSSLCSPLIWLSIGMSIADNKIRTVLVDKAAWLFSFIKLIIIPGVMMLMIGVIALNSAISINELKVITILMATPPATICVAYAIKTNRAVSFTSNASIISVIFTPIVIPIWIAIVELYGNGIGLL